MKKFHNLAKLAILFTLVIGTFAGQASCSIVRDQVRETVDTAIEPIRKDVEEIERAAEKAERLARNPQTTVEDIRAAIEEVIVAVERAIQNLETMYARRDELQKEVLTNFVEGLLSTLITKLI